MNKVSEFALKALRKTYSKVMHVPPLPKPACEHDPDVASQIIYDKLMEDKPCMIARFGSTELNMLVNYLGIKNNDRNILRYITGKSIQWWWGENFMNQIRDFSGFFPPTKEKITEFCEMMMEDMKEIDILASWRPGEVFFEKELRHSKKIHLQLLEPFWSSIPWTRILEGQKVLVVHPFAETIFTQYKKRELLFHNPDILPEFELSTIKAVQSLGGEEMDFTDWFNALNYMKSEIDKIDYDFCLIGCGAYGLPLAAYVKRMGKKAIHMGGALQLLFGIRGRRWDNPNYGVKEWGIPYGSYSSLVNEYWIRPGEDEKVKNVESVEGACYW